MKQPRTIDQEIALVNRYLQAELPTVTLTPLEGGPVIEIPVMFAWLIVESINTIGIRGAVSTMLLGAMMFEPTPTIGELIRINTASIERINAVISSIARAIPITGNESLEERAMAFTYSVIQQKALTWKEAAVFASLALDPLVVTETAWRLRVRRWAEQQKKPTAIVYQKQG